MKCINSKREGQANWVHAHLGSTQLPLSVSVPAVREREGTASLARLEERLSLNCPLLSLGHLLTFQPALAFLHVTSEIAHSLEEAEASLGRGSPAGHLTFSPFAPFIGSLDFHYVAVFIRWSEILYGKKGETIKWHAFYVLIFL